jgi:hypothetical protein
LRSFQQKSLPETCLKDFVSALDLELLKTVAISSSEKKKNIQLVDEENGKYKCINRQTVFGI